ncbi:hypothetical protein TGARI_371670 [Toxoplasma gondii ARI]|uniref:Uncharacterized protein n=1 Tax=Toxoplasma gondii ARI TaxID=1074872 RepID=A0A139XLV9_TOXGO|nr:hypothetical protein TGARI_371670 [Toxoplasma gondii ARI]
MANQRVGSWPLFAAKNAAACVRKSRSGAESIHRLCRERHETAATEVRTQSLEQRVYRQLTKLRKSCKGRGRRRGRWRGRRRGRWRGSWRGRWRGGRRGRWRGGRRGRWRRRRRRSGAVEESEERRSRREEFNRGRVQERLGKCFLFFGRRSARWSAKNENWRTRSEENMV